MDLVDRIIAREGGAKITNDPDDPGGLTKFGISKVNHPDVDVANLTYEQAKDIYIQKYFVRHNLQQLPLELQEPVMDFGVHSGPVTAIRFLQKCVGATQDGVLGNDTLARLKAAPLDAVLNAYRRERCLFLAKQVIDKPAKLKYLVGWLNRVLSI